MKYYFIRHCALMCREHAHDLLKTAYFALGSSSDQIECFPIGESVLSVLPEYTDHVALHVVVRLVALTPIPASRVLPDDIPTRCLHSFAHDDLRVTDIAHRAKEAAEHFPRACGAL